MELKRWDPSTLSGDETVLVLGERFSGKSTFMKKLLHAVRDKLDLVIVACPSEDSRQMYMEYVPSVFVYGKNDVEKIDKIISLQKKIHAVHPEKMNRIGIVFDDCTGDTGDGSSDRKTKSMANKIQKYFHYNGRHERFFVVNVTQNPVDIDKRLRPNIDIVVAFPQKKAYEECVWNNYLDTFPTLHAMQRAFEALRPHECLVNDTRSKKRGKESMFYYIAPLELEPFVCCKRGYWIQYYKQFKRDNKTEHERAILDIAKRKNSGGGGERGGDQATVLIVRKEESDGDKEQNPPEIPKSLRTKKKKQTRFKKVISVIDTASA